MLSTTSGSHRVVCMLGRHYISWCASPAFLFSCSLELLTCSPPPGPDVPVDLSFPFDSRASVSSALDHVYLLSVLRMMDIWKGIGDRKEDEGRTFIPVGIFCRSSCDPQLKAALWGWTVCQHAMPCTSWQSPPLHLSPGLEAGTDHSCPGSLSLPSRLPASCIVCAFADELFSSFSKFPFLVLMGTDGYRASSYSWT